MASTTVYTNYRWYNGTGYRLGVEVKQVSQNYAANQSTVSYRVFADNTGGSGWWVYYYNPEVTIEGQSISLTTNSYNGGQTLKSGNLTITHTTSGTKNVSISISANIYGSADYRSGSGTLTLNRIPRGIKNVVFSSGWSETEGSKVITYSSLTSGTKVVVWWRYYSNKESKWSGWYNIVKTDETHFPNDHSYPSGSNFMLNSQSLRDTMYNNKPTVTTGDIQVRLNVYFGSTLVETKDYTKSLLLKADVPNLNITAKYTDGTSTNSKVKLLSSTENTGITNLHKLTLTPNWSTTDGSSISKATVTFEGKTYNLPAKGMTLTPTKSGSQSISVTVTTARGKSTTKSTSVTNITDYSPPRLSGYQVYRANSLSGTTADPLGNYGIVKGSITHSSVKVGSSEKNSTTWKVEWGNSLSPRSGSSASIFAPAEVSAESSLGFTLTYGDAFTTNVIKGAIPPAQVPLAIGKYSIGINTIPNDELGGIYIAGSKNFDRKIEFTDSKNTWKFRTASGYSIGNGVGFTMDFGNDKDMLFLNDGTIWIVDKNGNRIKKIAG